MNHVINPAINPALNKGAKQREYFLDWIRVGVVLLLVPYHTAVSFSHIGKAYVYAEPEIHSWFYILMSDFLNLWFMRTLFFISGIAVFYAFKKRNPGQFIVERFKRLIIPIIFLLLTVGPLSGYILAVSRYGFTGSFGAFYPQYFLNLKQYLFWGQLWYCGYLFIFSCLFLPLFVFLKNRPGISQTINRFLNRKNNILLPGLLIVLFEGIFRPFFPGYQSFFGDWANVSVYGTLFILGYIMGQSGEIFDRMEKKIILTGITGGLSSLAYLILKRAPLDNILPFGDYPKAVLISILWGVAAYSLILFLLGITKKYLSHNNKTLQYLSKSSFSLYVFHYFIIAVLNYLLLKTSLNHYFIWGITTLGTYAVFTLLFELILKRIAPLRFILAIPDPPKKPKTIEYNSEPVKQRKTV